MTWNDFNVGDGNFKGKLLKNCMEVCRLALIERTTATKLYYLPKNLLQSVKHIVPKRAWFKEFEQAVDSLIPRFVNHTYNGGSWNQLDHRPPYWSKNSIMEYIGEPRIYMDGGKIIKAEWFSQQFKILNLLRQRMVCDADYPHGYLNPEWIFVFTEQTAMKYIMDLLIDKPTLSEAFPLFVEHWNTHSSHGSLITDAIGTVFTSYSFEGGYGRQCVYSLYRIKGRAGIAMRYICFPYTVSTDFYCRISRPGARLFYTFGEQPNFTKGNVYYCLNSAKINFSLKGRQYFPEFGSDRSFPKVPVKDAPWTGGWIADSADAAYCIIKFDGDGGFNFK